MFSASEALFWDHYFGVDYHKYIKSLGPDPLPQKKEKSILERAASTPSPVSTLISAGSSPSNPLLVED